MRFFLFFAIFSALLLSAPNISHADLLEEIIGKSLECETSNGTYQSGWGLNRFFFSKKSKMLWTGSEIKAGKGSTVALTKASILKRAADKLVISAKNLDGKPAKLTFQKSNGSIKLQRTDKGRDGSILSTEVCKFVGGFEKAAQQQLDAVLAASCPDDMAFVCTIALYKYCGEKPTEVCRSKNSSKISYMIENSPTYAEYSPEDALSERACGSTNFQCNVKLLNICGEHPTEKCWKLNRSKIK